MTDNHKINIPDSAVGGVASRRPSRDAVVGGVLCHHPPDCIPGLRHQQPTGPGTAYLHFDIDDGIDCGLGFDYYGIIPGQSTDLHQIFNEWPPSRDLCARSG
ncbi:hypothetical protein CYMTET_30467 [Cymbomonas tetramitiformis]|uniref:Uncharacterized protein n=1 Tax=Cymbomonas tetramitiformis TaxID=36881 RepID=A0AAE0FIR8_9CHLO|nr:hypothetical protein CYMTET_30467 [Cymbomonas tetramitiformis]|eukprot:gene17310-20603_t